MAMFFGARLRAWWACAQGSPRANASDVGARSVKRSMRSGFAIVLLALSALGWSASAAAQTVGVPYSTTFTATGGFPPYTWSRASGTLPPGLTLATNGVMSGTPTAAGTYSFVLRVTDTQGNTGTGPFTVTVAPPTIAITPSTLPDGTVNVAYNQALGATGGFAPHTFTLSAGSLPPGITLVGGALSGTPTTGGSFTFTIRAADNSGAPGPYAGTQTYTVAIAKADQSIDFGWQQAQVFSPGGTFALNPVAIASSGLPVSYSAVTGAVCSISGTTVTMLSVGQCQIAATQPGDASYNGHVFVQGIDITPATQAITNFIATPGAPIYAPGGTFTVSATGGASTSPVLFASATASVCSVSGNTVTMLSAGTCSLTADQAGDANYTSAPQATLAVSIGPASQAITNFIATPGAPTFAPGATFSVSATGGASTSPVLFASNTASVCTISGNTVTMLSAGTCSLTADQAGDANYTAAPQQTLDVAIAQASQAITGFIATPNAPVFAPGGNFNVSATGGASTSPVTFASTTASVCSVSGNAVTMLSAGTCSLTADQAGDANYTAAPQQTLDVAISQAGQAITNFVATPNAPVFAPNGTFNVSATGGASTSLVSFASTTASVCSVSGNTVTMLAAGTCSLTADQAGDANYTAASQATLDVAIGAASQAITNFTATPGAPVFAPGGTFDVSATGGASTSPVTFASASASVCSVSGSTVTMLSAGTCALTADQAGDANYTAAAQATLDVAIGAATQAITAFIATPETPVYAPGGTFNVSATGGASTSTVIFGSTTASVCSVSGNTVTMLSSGLCTLTADQAGTGSYNAAPQVTLDVAIGAAAPTLAWIGNRDMIVGQASFDLPDPTSPSTGAFTFSSSNPEVATVEGRTVTVVGPGVTTLMARQAAEGSYLAGEATATLTVSARPDPTRDAEVVGGLQAQVDTSVRFANAQQANIRDRLRQLRSGDGNPSHNGMTLNLMGSAGTGMSLPASQVAADERLALPEGWGFWTAGAITSGERDPRTGAIGFDFQSDGVSFGLDRSFGEHVVFGLAGGFGWDETRFASSSRQDADQRALTAYALWRAGEHLYMEGIFGTGQLEWDITRWSQVAGANATARRDGDQQYGSLAIGMEHVTDKMKLAGYARYDSSRTELEAYAEQGLGIYDLSYGAQTIDSRAMAVGVEGSHWMQGASIAFRPYWLLEYRDALQDDSDVAINYVIRPVASDYVLGLRSYNDDALVFGAGVDMQLFHGWTLSLLYRHEQAAGTVGSNTFGLQFAWRPAAAPAPAAAAMVPTSGVSLGNPPTP